MRMATARERRILDLRELTKRERAFAMETFERLAPGECLEIKTRWLPTQLFFELQQRYGLGFYWWPLERGPLEWRVKLAKPLDGASPTVTSMMAADRQRLSDLWREFEVAVGFCRVNDVHRHIGELSLGLRRYIDIEEAVLFPLLEAQVGMNGGGSTAAMRSEHRRIEQVVDQLKKLRSTRDCATILQTFDQPVEPMAFFLGHCHTEETVLYPLVEKLLDDAEKRRLLLLIQQLEI